MPPHAAKNASIADTGRNALRVLPTNTSIPQQKGSVFDRFNLTLTIEGFVVQSTVISPNAKWSFRSNALSDGAVISPFRKNKKADGTSGPQHNEVMLSRVLLHTFHIFSNSLGVMGRRVR